jgi:lipid A 3-O-deacylase
MRFSHLFLAAGVVALALPGLAKADAYGFLDEVRIGAYEHDASVLGHQKENGADIGAEFLFDSPRFLSIIGSPRPIIGGLANTSGQTDQIYTGLTWTWDFVHNVLNQGDAFYVEGTLGGGWNDGKINVDGATPEGEKRKSLGSNVLFREDLDLGYRITPRYSIAISYNHISNADLGERNEGINDIGVRFGIKF